MFLSSGTQKTKEFSRRTRKFTTVDSQPRRQRNSRESAILFPFSSINPHLSPSLLLTQNQASSSLNSQILSKTSMSIIRRSNIFDPFSFDIWNPFEGSNSSTETSAFAGTRIDWKETPEAHVFKADIPGVKKEEVKVEVVEGDVLQISGERKEEKEEKNDRWHRVERSSGKFLRRFRLPENVKVDQVKAAMENGVLSVVVPKEEVKNSEVKSIEISG